MRKIRIAYTCTNVWRRSFLNVLYRLKLIKFMCCLPTFKFHGISINKFTNKMRFRHALNVNHLIETIRCIQFVHGGHSTSQHHNKHTSLTHFNYDICPLFAMSYVYFIFSLFSPQQMRESVAY